MKVSSNPLMEEKMAEIPVIQRVIAVLWPSFITSGIATAAFFTVFDPVELVTLTGYLEVSRTGAYSIGFFLFWLLTSTTCALTCYFQKPCESMSHRDPECWCTRTSQHRDSNPH
jgi:hypothetical protein